MKQERKIGHRLTQTLTKEIDNIAEKVSTFSKTFAFVNFRLIKNTLSTHQIKKSGDCLNIV